jgi:glycosyltransferase involved in cell wall biosynthesis
MAAVTVAVPVRDRAALLEVTLRSVAEQTAPPLEVIVADDGSRDGSHVVAAAAGARVLRRAGGGWGAAGARNAMLAAARGERVLFLDSDDLLVPTALERLGAALDGAPAAPFAYGRALVAWRDGTGWRPAGLIAAEPRELADPLAALFARNAVPSAGTLVRTDAARAVGGYDASLAYSEDQDFFVRLAGEGLPVHVPAIVAVHRRHPGNRHRAFAALGSDRRISGLARVDPRLKRHLPARAGGQLAELALDAARTRRPGPLLRHGPPLVLGSGRPRRAVRAAGAYLRARRRWARAGDAAWAAEPELRAWLADLR